MRCSSSSTKRGTTSVPRMKPVFAMSTMRPSITALVSITTWPGGPARRATGDEPGGARQQHVPLVQGGRQHHEGQEEGRRRWQQLPGGTTQLRQRDADQQAHQQADDDRGHAERELSRTRLS